MKLTVIVSFLALAVSPIFTRAQQDQDPRTLRRPLVVALLGGRQYLRMNSVVPPSTKQYGLAVR